MVAIAASISSTSLFFPTLSFSLKLTTLSFTSPPIPIPRESNRYETLHSSPTHRRQIEVAPPHTPSKVRRPPTLRRSSTLHSDTILTQLHPTLRSHTHLQHLRSVTGEAIYGFGFWFVEEEHDWFGSGFWGAWLVGCDLGFGGGRSEILGCHSGHQLGVVVLWVDLGSWRRG